MRGTSGEIQPRREGTHFKFLLAVRLRLSLTAAHCSLSTLDSSPVTRTHARTQDSPSLSGICFCSNRRNEKKKTKENHCKRFLYLKSITLAASHHDRRRPAEHRRRDHHHHHHQVFRRICIIQNRVSEGETSIHIGVR